MSPRGGLGGDVLAVQIEDLAGGGIAQCRQQHDVAAIERGRDAVGVDPADHARVLEIDAVAHTPGARGDEVTAGDTDAGAGHGGVGQPRRQPGLERATRAADGLEYERQRGRVGDAQPVVIAGGDAGLGQARVDLGPRPVDEHQAHPKACQQGQVVDERGEVRFGEGLAPERQDERAPAVGLDVGRGAAEPGEVAVGVGVVRGHRRCHSSSRGAL